MVLGVSIAEIYDYTAIDPWFLDQLQELVEHERALLAAAANGLEAGERIVVQGGAALRPGTRVSINEGG